MSTSNFNLRGIPQEVMTILKKEAKQQHVSINLLILNLIDEGIGHTAKVKKMQYHDLDYLAGTWSQEDAKEFQKNLISVETIDKELWE